MPLSVPRTYSAFGLAVASDLPLDGFVPASPGRTPDVTVTAGPPASGHDGGQRVVARAEGVLVASVHHGREVTVDPSDTADPGFVSAVVTGELFSVVLRQRGLLVLHGSAVAKNGLAVGFVGNSGWGKSTLAASLVERGWRLLADDLLVVHGLGTDEAPTTIPTHPMMRLSQEALDSVDGGEMARGQAHALTTKVRVDQGAAFSDEPTPLARVWVLDPRLAASHASEAFTGLHAVHELVRHTRGRRLLDSEDSKATLLGQCADLARRVPVASLRRQFGLEHIGTLCDLVESEASA